MYTEDPAVNNMLGVMGATQNFIQYQQGQEDRSKKLQFEDRYKTYLAGLQNDSGYKPPTDSPDYNADAYNKAVVSHAQALSQTEQAKQLRFANLESEMKQKRASLMEIGQRAESVAVTDPQAAIAAYMTGYSKHPNGIDASFNPNTGKYDFHDNITGQSWSQEITLDEARQTFQAMMEKGEYEKLYLTDRSRVKRYNQAALSNPDILEDKDGNTLFRADLIDKNTGEKNTYFWDKGGEVVPMNDDQIRSKGFRLKADRQKERLSELGIKKEEAAIAQTKSQTEENKATTGLRNEQVKTEQAQQGLYSAQAKAAANKTDNLDTESKYIKYLAGVYGVSEAEAANIYRSDKTYKERLDQLYKYQQDEMLDLSDPEDEAKYNQKKTELGLDKPPGKEGYGLGIKQPPGTDKVPVQDQVKSVEINGKSYKIGQTFPSKSDKKVYYEVTANGLVQRRKG